jgi:hypothetical protein
LARGYAWECLSVLAFSCQTRICYFLLLLKGVLWIIDGLALPILTFNVENMLFSVVSDVNTGLLSTSKVNHACSKYQVLEIYGAQISCTHRELRDLRTCRCIILSFLSILRESLTVSFRASSPANLYDSLEFSLCSMYQIINRTIQLFGEPAIPVRSSGAPVAFFTSLRKFRT